MPGAPVAAGRGPGQQVPVDRLGFVFQFGQVEAMLDFGAGVRAGRLISRFDTGDGQAGRPGTGIELQRDGLELAVFGQSILEPDDERHPAVNHGPPSLEEQPGPFLRTGHQGLMMSIDHKHGHAVPLSFRKPRKGLVPRQTGLGLTALLDQVNRRYCRAHTDFDPVCLFSAPVPESGTGEASRSGCPVGPRCKTGPVLPTDERFLLT